MSKKTTLRIGGGAGFSGDRLEPAVDLVSRGNLDYLILECLAERTIALAQRRKLQDPEAGFDPLLERRMELLLPALVEHRVRLVTNFGAANPEAAARRVQAIARRLGLSVTVAAVSGDDVLDQLRPDLPTLETGRPLADYPGIISANAYLGVDAILPALAAGADIVVTGRVADPSLVLAPLMYHFGWSPDDVTRLGQGTVVGHLLECGAQVCGGYFLDANRKQVPDPAHIGYPIAEVEADGAATLTKLPATGGRIDLRTVKEQLLYEVIDPFAYLTPDVAADFSTVSLQQMATDEVHVSGGGGAPRPDRLKVSVGYRAGYRGEGEISYAGPGAVDRARLAGQIIRERLQPDVPDLRIDLVGVDSVNLGGAAPTTDKECRLRIAGHASDAALAGRVGEEVEALYTNGPFGGGGARKSVTEVIGIVSVLLDRKLIEPKLSLYRP
ncbi:acyclic terpene utilization AtuA family protein [Lewinella sp. IMCC34183]|uniref:acyclic terpene utilization AtuA family protein n=1 Tax=Lewinella sp. IMCC34183 TaxID=2248762 RepID=UPI000E289310|nr:acyclic terpene utilization AtuA family protein [Lewinella sp. IMCC34183]